MFEKSLNRSDSGGQSDSSYNVMLKMEYQKEWEILKETG